VAVGHKSGTDLNGEVNEKDGFIISFFNQKRVDCKIQIDLFENKYPDSPMLSLVIIIIHEVAFAPAVSSARPGSMCHYYFILGPHDGQHAGLGKVLSRLMYIIFFGCLIFLGLARSRKAQYPHDSGALLT
jgi:hypothetical protein